MEQWLKNSIPGIIVLGVIGSIIAATLLYLSKRVFPWIRRYAERTPRSVLRTVYYHAIIRAVNGSSRLAELLLVSILFLMILILPVTETYRNLAEYESLLGKTQAVRAELSATQPAVRATTQSVMQDLEVTESKLHALGVRARSQRLQALILAACGILWVIYLLALRQIAFQFDRLMTRLPGVVTKDEFRTLCRLEMDVFNRRTLVPFLKELSRLTSSYGLTTIFAPIEFSSGVGSQPVAEERERTGTK